MLSLISRTCNISKSTTFPIKSFQKRKLIYATYILSPSQTKQQRHKFHTHILEVSSKHRNKNESPKTAIINSDGTSLTYQEIHQRSYALSQVLLKEHPALSTKDLHERRVAFICEPSSSYLISLFSIWGAGGIAVPIHHKFPTPEVEYIMQEANVSFILFDKQNQHKVDWLSSEMTDNAPSLCVDRYTKGKRALVDAERLARKRMKSNLGLIWDSLRYSRDRGAYIIFTSGTTGTPKGVVVTHGNVMSQVNLCYNLCILFFMFFRLKILIQRGKFHLMIDYCISYHCTMCMD